MLEGPVMLTNTHSVGTVHQATIDWRVRHGNPDSSGYWWSTPVVAETWDGELNDVNGFHVKPEHVDAALDGAEVRPGRRGQRRRRHRHDLPRFQVRHRHVVAPRRRGRPRLHRRRAGAGELRHAIRRFASRASRSASSSSRSPAKPSSSDADKRLDHHRDCDRCAAAAAPAQSHREARRHGARAHGLLRRQRLGRHLRRFLDRERQGHGRRRHCSPPSSWQWQARRAVRGDRAGDRGSDRQCDGRGARHGRQRGPQREGAARTMRFRRC